MRFKQRKTSRLATAAVAALCLTACQPSGNSGSAASQPAVASPADISTCRPALAYTQATVPASTILGEPATKVIVKTDCSGSTREFVPPSGSSYSFPGMSPNGQSIVFSVIRDDGGSVELYIGSIATGKVSKLTTQAGFASGAKFSPDGTKIAYSWAARFGTNLNDTGVYVVPANGSDAPVKVSDLLEGYPAWSPDGKSLAVTESQGQDNLLLVTVDVATHAQTQLALGLLGSTGVAFYSPDGKFLIFPHSETAGSGQAQLWIYDLATKQKRQLTHLPYGLSLSSEISMDNAWTLYYTVVPGSQQINPATDIHMLNLSTGADKVLPPDLAGIDYSVSAARTGAVAPAPVVFGESCPTLEFIGVRGSGETADQNRGLAPTVAAVESELKRRWPDMYTTAIDYPAIAVEFSLNYPPDYAASVAAGKRAFVDFYQDFTAACPAAQIVVVGYSQGAEIVGDLLENSPPADRKQIVATVLFGDPNFNPGQASVDAGNFDPSLHGIISVLEPHDYLHVFPGDMVGHIRSYCIATDPICNYMESTLVGCHHSGPACAHFKYGQLNWTVKAAAWIAGILTAPKLPTF